MATKTEHLLCSIQRVVMEEIEPYRSALIKKAHEKGLMYTLKYVGKDPKGLRTRWDGVNRHFNPGEQKMLSALVAAALVQTYNVDMVAGSATHPGGQGKDSSAPAPFQEPNFEEVVDHERSDLGPELRLVHGGVSLQSELLQEVKEYPKARGGSKATSAELSSDEIMEAAKGQTPGATPRPAPSGDTI